MSQPRGATGNAGRIGPLRGVKRPSGGCALQEGRFSGALAASRLLPWCLPLLVAAFGLPKAPLHHPARQTPLSFRDLIRGSLDRVQAHREVLDAADEVVGQANHVADQLHLAETLQYLLPQHLELQLR